MTLRDTNVERLTQRHFDVLVVGGGINGAVSAAALSGRGASVALIDRADFASFTSQESSNLVWGGIKYLENYEFPLVWDLCGSRNRLLEYYPANVREVRFFTAVEKSFRWHPWLMTAGSWLYWAMGRGYTQTPRLLTRGRIVKEEPALNAERFRGGVEYSDAYLVDNDARFVFSFVRSALNAGAVVANYVELLSVERDGEGFRCRLRDNHRGGEFEVRCKTLINAAGPYVDGINGGFSHSTEHRHVFSRGIHLIVDRISSEERVLTFFDDTGRMFFVIPMGPRSVIGTTDTRVDDPHTEVTDEDRKFLLDNANQRLNLPKPLTTDDIISERCGVRPLVVSSPADAAESEWFALSRKHVLESHDGVISMFGGKLTDCLNVGAEVCELVERRGITLLPDQHNWFGEPRWAIRNEFFRQARLMDLDSFRDGDAYERLSTRLWRRYGLRSFTMLEAIRREQGMEEVLIEGAQYLKAELHHAANTEMVTRLDDFLRRRSKIALVLSKEDIRKADGVMDACRILFGDEAQLRFNEYFDDTESTAS